MTALMLLAAISVSSFLFLSGFSLPETLPLFCDLYHRKRFFVGSSEKTSRRRKIVNRLTIFLAITFIKWYAENVKIPGIAGKGGTDHGQI
ncbi:MAG: hypothetical protein IJB04_07000 [Oscillospiraceae bacterium]|nr:hypothetical protein [Oscillospiraceae bacterium]